MSGARVTIGVPVRNGESELAASLACLSKQTCRDLEILVSDDRTAEIVVSLAAIAYSINSQPLLY